jgi:hypothetical protein
MSKIICKAKKTGEVKERGKASIEWRDDDGKPQYYCYGYINQMTDELLDVCRGCKDNVIYAQEDLDNYGVKKVEGVK